MGRRAPIARETVPEQVYQEMRQAIIRGDLKPGQRLTINALAETFGTSHMPAREAIRRLVSLGALEVMQSRAVGIPALDRKRLNDIMRIRARLESLATRWAAENMRPPHEARLARLGERIAGMVKERSMSRFLEAHQEFQFAIYEAAEAPTILPLIESLWLQSGPYLNLLLANGSFWTVHHEHTKELLDNLFNHRAAKAAAIIETGILTSLELINQVLDAQEQGQAKPRRRKPA